MMINTFIEKLREEHLDMTKQTEMKIRKIWTELDEIIRELKIQKPDNPSSTPVSNWFLF